MARPKFDVVVEAVHYGPDGQIAWVRGYVRRGVVFSDRVLIPREALVQRLKAGKVFVTGRRISQLGNTFDVSRPIQLIHNNGHEVIITGPGEAESDRLDGVPVA